MLHSDLKQPVANFKCGELEESYPEAHKAFLEDFVCSITMVDFAVDGERQLWAFVGDGEVYKWQPMTLADAVEQVMFFVEETRETPEEIRRASGRF